MPREDQHMGDPAGRHQRITQMRFSWYPLGMVLVPWQQLKAATLEALIEEFVTRDGAEHGHREVPLGRKIEQVRELLRRGDAVISFDEEEGTATIVLKEAWPGHGNGHAPDDPDTA
jgi:uncharacterized protein YheU (UPF0270 family)